MSNFKLIANVKIEKLVINTSITFHQNKVISKPFLPSVLTDYRKSAVIQFYL